MGCLKLTYYEEEGSLGVNWKVFQGGLSEKGKAEKSIINLNPFGMLQPDRNEQSDAYRYGFNGKEKDSEWNSGNVYDYGFRIYDPRIAKFLSVDPLSPEYPMLTPYQFASNTPIMAIDLDGLEAYIRENYDSQGKLESITVVTEIQVINSSELTMDQVMERTDEIARTHNEEFKGKVVYNGQVVEVNSEVHFTMAANYPTATLEFVISLPDPKVGITNITWKGVSFQIRILTQVIVDNLQGKTSSSSINRELEENEEIKEVTAKSTGVIGSHELGHGFGETKHSEDVNNTMYKNADPYNTPFGRRYDDEQRQRAVDTIKKNGDKKIKSDNKRRKAGLKRISRKLD